jgi:phage baseplate assembly protein W
MAQQQNRPDPTAARFLKYPYGVGGSSVPQTTTADDHLRDLILQVLFTSPGERVNLPEFGAGVQRLVFEPAGDALRASAEFLISTNLQRWLGDRIDVERVIVTTDDANDGVVTIDISYSLKATQQRGSVVVRI